MDGPLIWSDGAETLPGQVCTLSDAHASVTDQQEGICAQVVAADELLLEEFILLCCERPWKLLRGAWNVFATNQVGEFSLLSGPCQIAQDRAQCDEQVDVRGGRQWRLLRMQARHPSEDVGIPAQLIQVLDLGMMDGEIGEEVAHRTAVVTRCVGVECSTDGIDGTIEDRCQRMMEWRAPQEAHEAPPGTGRTHCAT